MVEYDGKIQQACDRCGYVYGVELHLHAQNGMKLKDIVDRAEQVGLMVLARGSPSGLNAYVGLGIQQQIGTPSRFIDDGAIVMPLAQASKMFLGKEPSVVEKLARVGITDNTLGTRVSDTITLFYVK